MTCPKKYYVEKHTFDCALFLLLLFESGGLLMNMSYDVGVRCDKEGKSQETR
jgi:hypothetical protein